MKYLNIDPIIDNAIEIKSRQRVWDLRNDVDFIEVHYNVLENFVSLKWRYPSEWYKKENNVGDTKIFLTFIFESIDFFEIDSSSLYGLKSDITILEGIVNYYERRDGSFDDDNFMTFEFGNGLKIIVKAGTLKFQLDEINNSKE